MIIHTYIYYLVFWPIPTRNKPSILLLRSQSTICDKSVDRQLSETESDFKDLSANKLDGIWPVSLLDRTSYTSRFGEVRGTITPESLFCCRKTCFTSFNFPISLGKIETNILEDKSKFTRFEIFPIDGGILPLSLLLFKSKFSRFKRLPINSGTVPLRWFLDKYKFTRFERLPIDNGETICS